MKRGYGVVCLVFVVVLVMACNLPVASGVEKMKPVSVTTTGDRVAFSGSYSCNTQDEVRFSVDENGIATITTTGIVFVDYINCTPDPSGFKITYTISGLADPDVKTAIFTTCNDGGFKGSGEVTFVDDKPMGSVSCTHATGEEAGEVAITLWIPSNK